MSTVVKDRLSDIILNPRVKGSRKSDSWHPSSASVVYLNQHDEEVVVGRCLRQQYYDRTGVEGMPADDVTGVMKAMAGNVWSDWLVTRIKEAGFWYGDEVSFYDTDLNCSGRVDVIVKEEGTNHPIGVEIKTTGLFLSDGVIKHTAKKPLAPKEDHTLQCMVYLYHWMKFGIKKWVLFYMGRDSFEQNEHIIRLVTDPETKTRYPIISNEMGTMDWKHLRLEDIIKRWHELADHLKKKTVPPRDFEMQFSNDKIVKMFHRGELTKTNTNKIAKKLQGGPVDSTTPPVLTIGDWQCRFCAFADTCYGSESSDVDPHVEQLNASL